MHKNLLKKFYYIDNFDKGHLEKINKNVSIIYRNYNEDLQIEKLKKVRNFCKKKGLKIYLANNLKLAKILKFDGLYIPSYNKSAFNKENLRKKFLFLGSAHNKNEIIIKKNQQVDYIFISPLFNTKDKKGLGIIKFNNLTKFDSNNFVALGGINKENLQMLKQLNICGYAGITYIKNFA